MNSRERFFNLIAGKPVDRRPFGAILSLYGAGLTNCPLERFYNDAESYARGQTAVLQIVKPDFLFGPFLLSGFGEAFGGKLHYTKYYVPALLRPAISSAAEINALCIPDPDTNPRLLFYRESIRRISRVHRRDNVIVGIVLNPLDLPIMIMGLDAWLCTVLSDEEGTRRMLDITTPFFIHLCEKLFSDGADILAMPMAFFTRDITSNRLATDFALPALREALSSVKGPLLLHHTGSSFFDYLGALDKLPGVAGFTMHPDDNLFAARRRIRKTSILFGGLDGPSIHTLTPESIRVRCFNLLAAMQDDSRYIPFAASTDVELHAPVANLKAFKQAVDEFNMDEPCATNL